MYHRKDASLDSLARSGNVAQFVAYEPDASGAPVQTFARIAGFDVNHRFRDVAEAVRALLDNAPDRSVNVRSYAPDSPRSREFIYGLISAEEAEAALRRLSGEGLHVILNETVDVEDGGVSGVVQGGVMEFAPDATPRCVEEPGVASLPLDLGLDLLEVVYGFRPELPHATGRIEFSIHPVPRGWQSSRTLLWELEETAVEAGRAYMTWPNRFSRHLGDKAYGLLMAHLAGMPVPSTLAIPRRVAPFRFGRATGSEEIWIRTCPKESEPGLFTTRKGWIDPFALLAREDPEHSRIAAVLTQAAVRAWHSGAALVDGDGRVAVEGVPGEGDLFMLGVKRMADLPTTVTTDVADVMERLRERFGATRIEWVHDGSTVWIVQLHLGATVSTAAVLVPGEAAEWVDFPIEQGLEGLRRLLSGFKDDTGLRLVGQVGMTSHLADLVRKSGVPTRVVPSAAEPSADRIPNPSEG